METALEEILLDVWRQVLVENSERAEVGGKAYPVVKTPKLKLREVNFVADGRAIRGLEQNPETKSRWAQLARVGKKVMQFIGENGYIAVAVDGNLTAYGKK